MLELSNTSYEHKLLTTALESSPESHVNCKHLLDVVSSQFIRRIGIIRHIDAHHIAHLLNLRQPAYV